MKNINFKLRVSILCALLVVAAAVSAQTLPTDHPEGSMVAGGGASSSQKYELIGAIPIGGNGASYSSRYQLVGGLVAEQNPGLIFEDGLEP